MRWHEFITHMYIRIDANPPSSEVKPVNIGTSAAFPDLIIVMGSSVRNAPSKSGSITGLKGTIGW